MLRQLDIYATSCTARLISSPNAKPSENSIGGLKAPPGKMLRRTNSTLIKEAHYPFRLEMASNNENCLEYPFPRQPHQIDG